MTTHRTPSTVRAAHTALPSSGRNRSSMKPSQRVRSDVPAAGPGQPDSVTRSSSRQDSSKKWVTRMSPGKPTREGCDECGAKLIRTVLNYELAARSYTTVSVAGGTGFSAGTVVFGNTCAGLRGAERGPLRAGATLPTPYPGAQPADPAS